MGSTFFCSRCGAANESTHQQCFACGHLPTNETELEDAQNHDLLHGRYLPGSPLGSGGFSRVYRASDQLSNGRDVAIKEISLQGLSTQEIIEATETFHREMRILAPLNHPQIPKIYNHFNDQNHWYLVLEYIAGQTLETFLDVRETRKQPLLLHEILDMALQLCMVLDYLHNRRPPIIYRDLKPSNIMLTPQGSLVLIDFGIARSHRPGQIRDTHRLGSPGYAAPEQYGSAQTTPQSDIFSLGALLSFLLSGQDPAEETPPARGLTARSYEHEAERKTLATLVQRMRSLDSRLRPQNCQEVVKELKAIKQQLMIQGNTGPWRSPIPVPPSPQYAFGAGQQQIQRPAQPTIKHSKNRRRLVIGLGLLTTVVGGSTIELWSNWDTMTRSILTYGGHTGYVNAVAWSPDGIRIASASNDGTVQIWDASTGQTIFRLPASIINLLNANTVAWSPDGKRIASTAISGDTDSNVQIWDSSDGTTLLTRPIYTDNGNTNVVAWSPDGKNIASTSVAAADIKNGMVQISNAPNTIPVFTSDTNNTIQIWDASTGHTILTHYQRQGQQFAQGINAVAWSPDGKSITSVLADTVQIWDATDGHIIMNHGGLFSQINAVAWSPDGRSIASTADNTVQVWNVNNVSESDDMTLIYQQSDIVNTVAWSPDGNRIASAAANTVVVWDATDGHTIFTYRGHTSTVNAVAWSPDGKRLASASSDNTVKIWNAS